MGGGLETLPKEMRYNKSSKMLRLESKITAENKENIDWSETETVQAKMKMGFRLHVDLMNLNRQSFASERR